MRINKCGSGFGSMKAGVIVAAALSMAACGQAPELEGNDAGFSFVGSLSPEASDVDLSGELVVIDAPGTRLIPVDGDAEEVDASLDEDADEGEMAWRDFVEQLSGLKPLEVHSIEDESVRALVDGDHQSGEKYFCDGELGAITLKFTELRKVSAVRVASTVGYEHPAAMKMEASLNGEVWRLVGSFDFTTPQKGSQMCGDGETSFGGEYCSPEGNNIQYELFSDFDTVGMRMVRLTFKSRDCERGAMMLNEVEFF